MGGRVDGWRVMEIRTASFVSNPVIERSEIAFAGRSNVGKSSLINCLLGRKNLARTSGAPGKTRTFNYYNVNDRFYFVDMPGYGYAKTSRKNRELWGRRIGRYLAEGRSLRLLIHCIDSRHPPQTMDEDVLALMRGEPVPYIIALTKTDKLSGNGRAQSAGRIVALLKRAAIEAPVVMTSATDGRGREELLRWVGDVAA